MTIYILIVSLYYDRAGITAEFTSLDKCKAAGEAVLKMDSPSGYGGTAKYVCVEK